MGRDSNSNLGKIGVQKRGRESTHVGRIGPSVGDALEDAVQRESLLPQFTAEVAVVRHAARVQFDVDEVHVRAALDHDVLCPA